VPLDGAFIEAPDLRGGIQSVGLLDHG
jgi:hypothetical protein